jgi:hypothetical protein
VQKTATSDQELFGQMTELYPHWVANQSWLMFGFPQPQPASTALDIRRVIDTWLEAA